MIAMHALECKADIVYCYLPEIKNVNKNKGGHPVIYYMGGKHKSHIYFVL